MGQRKRFALILFTGLLMVAAYVVVKWWQTTAVTAASVTSIGLDAVMITASTDELIAFWHSRVQQHPHDPISLAYLGQAHWQKGRETGDAASYSRAQAALTQALTLKPDDELALALLAAVSLAQHDFQGALALAQRVYDFDPGALQALATIGDAHLELGHYAAAETAYRELQQKSDSPAVYGRLARLAWLQGDAQSSIVHMQQAAAKAAALGLRGEQLAWYHAQLGELYFHMGRLDEAQAQYQKAAGAFDGYYLAQAGLGNVYAASGDLDKAIALYTQLTAAPPQTEFVARLGDWYALNGHPAAAQKQYETVTFMAEVEAANAVLTNRQLALFYANHDRHLETALALAERELETRGDIYAYDTLAWALYKNGRTAAAAAAMETALAQGTSDALLYYHAGMIFAAQDQTAEAVAMLQKALALNPYFDLLQAQIAQETIAHMDHLRVSEEMP